MKRDDKIYRIDFFDCLMAAALAPLFFTISTIIVYAIFNRRTISSTRHLSFLSVEDIWGFFLTATICPAIYGFLVGTDGVVRALGHMFLTHPEGICLTRTLLHWIAFGLLAIVAVKMIS